MFGRAWEKSFEVDLVLEKSSLEYPLTVCNCCSGPVQVRHPSHVASGCTQASEILLLLFSTLIICILFQFLVTKTLANAH